MALRAFLSVSTTTVSISCASALLGGLFPPCSYALRLLLPLGSLGGFLLRAVPPLTALLWNPGPRSVSDPPVSRRSEGFSPLRPTMAQDPFLLLPRCRQTRSSSSQTVLLVISGQEAFSLSLIQEQLSRLAGLYSLLLLNLEPWDLMLLPTPTPPLSILTLLLPKRGKNSQGKQPCAFPTARPIPAPFHLAALPTLIPPRVRGRQVGFPQGLEFPCFRRCYSSSHSAYSSLSKI